MAATAAQLLVSHAPTCLPFSTHVERDCLLRDSALFSRCLIFLFHTISLLLLSSFSLTLSSLSHSHSHLSLTLSKASCVAAVMTARSPFLTGVDPELRQRVNAAKVTRYPPSLLPPSYIPPNTQIASKCRNGVTTPALAPPSLLYSSIYACTHTFRFTYPPTHILIQAHTDTRTR